MDAHRPLQPDRLTTRTQGLCSRTLTAVYEDSASTPISRRHPIGRSKSKPNAGMNNARALSCLL
jgi:hypothetical protein